MNICAYCHNEISEFSQRRKYCSIRCADKFNYLKREKPLPTEFDEQAAVVEYLELLEDRGLIIEFSAVPNNTFTRSWTQLRKQKKEGVRKGVPDIIFITKWNVCFLEMKRKKGGFMSPEQRGWADALSHTKAKYCCARGFEEAKLFIDQIVDSELPENNEMMEA